MQRRKMLFVVVGVVLMLLLIKNNGTNRIDKNSIPEKIETKQSDLDDYYTSQEIKKSQNDIKNKRMKELSKLITYKKYYEAYQYASENEYISNDFVICKNYSYALFLLKEKETGYSITAYLNKIPPHYNGPFSKDIKRLVLKYMTVKEWEANYQAGQNL